MAKGETNKAGEKRKPEVDETTPKEITSMLGEMAAAKEKSSLRADPIIFEGTEGVERRFIFIGNGESPFDNNREGTNRASFFFDENGKRCFTNYHKVTQACKNLKGYDDGKKTFVEITFKGMIEHPTDSNKTMADFDISVVK